MGRTALQRAPIRRGGRKVNVRNAGRQNLTITESTMTTISSVGTSFIIR